MSALVEHARRYADLHWALVRVEGKAPKGNGWQNTEPEPAELAAGKWSQWSNWNMGVVCGPSHVAVLDVDLDDADAATLRLLNTETLPATPIVRTGSGRLQVYFADPGGIEKSVRDGFELRVGPHMCVAPPSVHPETGKPYTWLDGREPWTVPLAPLPAELLAYFTNGNSARNGHASAVGDEIPQGKRDGTLASLAGSMRRRGMGEAEILAALRVTNEQRCRPPLADKDLERIAASIARYEPNRLAGADPGPDPTKPLPDEPITDGGETAAPVSVGAFGIRGLDTFAIRKVEWLDKPFFQRSAFHLLAGRKGTCKGTFICGLSAKVTTGRLYAEPRRVLVVTSEDSVELDFLPRFVAAGGDRSMVKVINDGFELPKHCDWLEETARSVGNVGLIVIDPIGNHTGGIDSDKEGLTRTAISPLNGISDRLDTMIVGVRHLSKDASRGALASVLGSTAWGDVPRCVILMARDDEDEMRFHYQVVAGNRGPRSTGRTIRLTLVDVPPAEEITLAIDEGASTKDVEDLLGQRTGNIEPSRSERARNLILDTLELEGDQESDALDARIANEIGLAARTIRNLRTELTGEGLIRSRSEKDEHGAVKRWLVCRTLAPRDDT